MNCRSCKSDHVVEVLDLGEHRLPDFVTPEQYDMQDLTPYPLKLRICLDCTLLQLAETTPRARLYHDRYGFRSGTNEAIRRDLEDVVRYACTVKPGIRRWLDIACNDGTLLSFVPKDIHRTGIDPVSEIAQEAMRKGRADRLIYNYFGAHYFHPNEFDVITSVSMFYDLDDPNRFVREVEQVLAPGGVWVIQQNYAGDMIRKNAVDNVCLPPGDPVITSEGMKPIGEVRTGDLVLTHTGSYKPVEEVITRPYGGPMVSVRAYGFGHTLQVTPGHPVLTPNGFVKASDLKIGDVVGRAIPSPDAKPSEDQVFGKTLAAVCGYYLAEGTIGVHGTAVSFCFGTNEAEEGLAEDCLRLVHDLGVSASLHHARTSTVVEAYGWLPEYLVKNFGKGSENKRIPAWDMDQGSMEELFRCYVAGDGYVYRGSYLRASTISRQLALDVQMLANRLGYKASITEQERPETCVIEGRTVSQKPLWDVLVHRSPTQRQKVWIEDGVQWGKIREITEQSYTGTVVNLEVADDHSYSSPAMTVHNCHEHVTYFALLPLMILLERHGLEINDVTFSSVNGGCIRTLVSRIGDRPVSASVQAAYERETLRGLHRPEIWKAWGTSVKQELDLTRGFLERAKERGEKVYLYGASTRGGTFLQMIDAGPEVLPYAVERSPAKVGKIMSSTGIPIISEEAMRHDQPDYLLISPWFFRSVFLTREVEYLRAGGRMAFPLPHFEIVSRHPEGEVAA